jgi:hypothetical protein
MKIRDWANWEKYPWYIFYAPLSLKWAFHCLRARSLWFFTASNPTITFGGFEGEGKREIYEQLPEGSYPHTMYVQPGEDFSQLLDKVQSAGFTFPFAVKPDVGMSGVFFRKIDNAAQFMEYHSIIPVMYLVQQWVDYPMEISVFYCRIPDAPSGEITGITRRDLLQVTGNGRSTLWELTQENPFAQPYLVELKKKYAELINWVVPHNEPFLLFHAANRNRGAHLVNLLDESDAALLRFFDHLFDHNKVFFYGRYDIKCTSLDDLKTNKNYTILEYNGAGAGPNHVYHRGLTLVEAWREVSRHWKYLLAISRYNHQAGVPYWPLMKGIRFLLAARRQFKFLQKTDTTF